jgi:hypothetical protein
VLVQAMLMMAGGGEAGSDIEKLRAQPTLFGAVEVPRLDGQVGCGDHAAVVVS